MESLCRSVACMPTSESDPKWPCAVLVKEFGAFKDVVAVGGKLCPEVLLSAYSQGIFPWPDGEGALVWWSPDPRLVLRPERLRVRRALRKSLRNAGWNYTLNSRFSEVVSACAGSRPKQDGTWITSEMRDVLNRLHALGFAHSVEVSNAGGSLLGGLYGLGIGRMFFGESMFSVARDASKAALYQLCGHLLHHGLSLVDCQIETRHLRSLGGEFMSRNNFCAEVERLCCLTVPEKLWLKQKLSYEVC